MPPHEIPGIEDPEEYPLACTLVWDDRYNGNREGSDEDDDFIQVWEVNKPLPRAFLTRKVAFSSDPSDDPLVQSLNWAAKGIYVVVVEDPGAENRTFAYPDYMLSHRFN